MATRKSIQDIPVTPDEQPLLRALVAEAARKGDTLASLAQALGVTYERLAQWRRGEGSIATAKRSVHEKAAGYLRMPIVLILALAGQIRAEDFVWPGRASLRERLAAEIERIKHDPHVGAFVPRELSAAPESVRLFVLFLCQELDVAGAGSGEQYRWMTALHRAVIEVHRPSLRADDVPGKPTLF